MQRILLVILMSVLVPPASLDQQPKPQDAAAASSKDVASGTSASRSGAGQSSSAKNAKEAIEQFNRKFLSACQEMDLPASAALWADDGVDLLPGMEPMVGKETIARWLHGLTDQMRGAKMLNCEVEWREITIQGDWAYEWGINKQRIALPQRPEPLSSEGKILLILKRQPDGSWKLALESWNDLPQPKKNP